MKITRRKALTALGGLAAAGRMKAWTLPPRSHPNILFIITDDQRQDALSCYGNRILHTPNIDRLATEGVRFTQAFVTNSLCMPGRATFLTGLYSHAHGVMTNGEKGAPASFRPGVTGYPMLLQKAGYETALLGKWHIRSDPEGFDHWSIFPGQGRYRDPILLSRGNKMEFTGHACDVVGDLALDFLKQPRRKPFLLYCGFKAPHRPWEPPPRLANLFQDVRIPEPPTFHDELRGRPAAVRDADNKVWNMPDFIQRGVPETLPPPERKRENLQALVKNYYRTITAVDQNVGRLLERLDRSGLAEDTVVVFVSDNGFFLGDHGMFDKRLMYEESIRVPLIVRYPPLVRRGQTSDQMVLNTDMAPTLLELAGLPVPEGLHGRSLVPLLRGRPEASWRNSFLYEYYEFPGSHMVRKNRGVRAERWKYIHYWESPEEFELYDLKNDPREVNNLYGNPRYADRVKELRDEMARLRKETGDTP